MILLKLIWHVILLVGFKLPVQLLGYVVLGVYFGFFNDPHNNRLPKYLKWFGVWEFKKYGIDGDYVWRQQHSKMVTLKDGDMIFEYQTAWPRYKYNALRNPVNHFQWEVLGKAAPVNVLLEILGTADNTNSLGYYIATLYDENDAELKHYAWEIYAHIKYPLVDKGFRARIGYKISGIQNEYVKPRLQYAFSITPWKSLPND